MTNFDATLLTVWIVFGALGVLAASAVLVWAIRSRQFSGQQRAAHLALWAGIVDEPAQGKDRPPDKRPA